MLAAAPDADVKVRWVSPMRFAVFIVDKDAERLLFEAPQRELFRKYPALRKKSVEAITSSCVDALALNPKV